MRGVAGQVTNSTDFGAFVDVGAADGKQGSSTAAASVPSPKRR